MGTEPFKKSPHHSILRPTEMPQQTKPKRPQPPLTSDEMVRYSRHLALPDIGIAGQRKLKSSSVLVVGMGGLGTPAAVYLAAAGVGRIGIVDSDKVEESNLHRQFLFSESDVGLNKTDVAKSRLLQVNPNTAVEAFQLRLDSSNAKHILRGFDVVVDATDNLPSRYLINDACVLLGKPDVYASALQFDGQASVFFARKGPCYRCLYPEPPPPDQVESCEQAGVLGVVPGMMGTLQAVQAISLVLGRGSPLVGRLLVFSGLDSSFNELTFRKDPRCPVCSKNPTIRKLIDYEAFCGSGGRAEGQPADITPIALKASIEGGTRPLLLDVREPYEHRICRLEGSKLIPLGQLSERMRELDRNRDIVAYCHHGNRSAVAVQLLKRAGYERVRNLEGGIEAWATQVDPETTRY